MFLLAFSIPNPFDLVGGAIGWVAGKAGDVVAGTAEGVLNAVAGWVLDGAFFMAGLVFDAIFTVNSPQLTSGWFSGAGSPYSLMANIGVSLLGAVVVIGVIRGVLTGDVGMMTRRFTVGLPSVVLILTTIVAFAQIAVDLTDYISEWLWTQGGNNAGTMSEELAAVRIALVAFGGSGVIPFVLVVAAGVLLVAALLIFVVLLIRASLIYLLVALVPLAALALVSGHRAMFTKTIELLFAFIVSKIVIVLSLVIGLSGFAAISGDRPSEIAGPTLTGPDGTPIELIANVDPDCDSDCEVDSSGVIAALGAMLVGAACFVLGVFSPWMLMRLMPGGEPTQTAHPGTGGVMHAVYTGRSLRPRSGGPRSATARGAAATRR